MIVYIFFTAIIFSAFLAFVLHYRNVSSKNTKLLIALKKNDELIQSTLKLFDQIDDELKVQNRTRVIFAIPAGYTDKKDSVQDIIGYNRYLGSCHNIFLKQYISDQFNDFNEDIKKPTSPKLENLLTEDYSYKNIQSEENDMIAFA